MVCHAVEHLTGAFLTEIVKHKVQIFGSCVEMLAAHGLLLKRVAAVIPRRFTLHSLRQFAHDLELSFAEGEATTGRAAAALLVRLWHRRDAMARHRVRVRTQ